MSEVDDIEAVRAVIERYIDGSRRGDAATLRAIFHPNAVMAGYVAGTCMDSTPEAFFRMADGTPQPDKYRASITEIRVHGRAATATLVENGFAGLDFIDCFHLLETDGTWRIVSKLFHHH